MTCNKNFFSFPKVFFFFLNSYSFQTFQALILLFHSLFNSFFSLIVSIQPQNPLCLYANRLFILANFGRQSFSKIVLSFFKNLKILLDITKNPPLIYSVGFSLMFLTLEFKSNLRIPLGFLYLTAVNVAIFIF